MAYVFVHDLYHKHICNKYRHARAFNPIGNKDNTAVERTLANAAMEKGRLDATFLAMVFSGPWCRIAAVMVVANNMENEGWYVSMNDKAGDR